MPSESFTTSLRSVNSPAFIEMYDKRELPVVSILPPLSCWCNNWTTPYTYSRVRADMRERASTRASASRAPLACARERPGHASHLLATRTRLSS